MSTTPTRRASCPKCGYRHTAADAPAVGRFSRTAPRYRAASQPQAPLRATRAQAIDDECAARQARNAARRPRATSVLTFEQEDTPAGQHATALAECLHRAQVPGPLATATGGNNLAVVVPWPSGNDRIVIGVEVWDDTPTFHVAAYQDREHDEPVHAVTAHDVPTVVADVVRLLTADTPPRTTPHPDAPWTAPHGLAVTVHRPDGTTSTAQVVALVERDDVAQTVRAEALGTPGAGLVIVRGDGATLTGHEPLTGITRPLPLHDRATN